MLSVWLAQSLGTSKSLKTSVKDWFTCRELNTQAQEMIPV